MKQSTTLILQNDRHSKQYNIQLKPAVAELDKPTDGWVVTFQFGAIGKALMPGTKTKVPVAYDKALIIFDKLVREKTSKRCDCCSGQYVSTEFKSAESSPVAQRANSSTVDLAALKTASLRGQLRFDPELLEPIDIPATSKEPDLYTFDDSYGAQRKYDGIRLAIHFDGVTCTGFNRKGEPVTVPALLEEVIRQDLPGMFDGEWIATVGEYIAFDLLEHDGVDIRNLPYQQRHRRLRTFDDGNCAPFRVAPLYIGTEAKKSLLKSEINEAGEGIVYKKLSAAYMPGRRGINIKRKLWCAATVRVCEKKKDDGRNSFAMEMWMNSVVLKRWINVGQVTCKGPLPAPGTYREVKYLYLGAGSRMVQAEDLGPRTDVDDSDCSLEQCKRKQVGNLVSA